MGGGLMQLVAYGAQDIYLTGNPQMTFFKVVYRRHTNFAIESISQSLTGNIDFGKKFSCSISRNGDLLHEVFLECDITFPELKNLTAFTQSGNYIHSSVADSEGSYPHIYKRDFYREQKDKIGENFGFKLIDYVELEIGGQVIDKHYGEWMEIWTSLTYTQDRINMLKKMIDYEDNITSKKLTIPLQFWFCRNPGLALPLIALQYHEVKMHFQMKPLPSYLSSSEASSCSFGAQLYCDYVFLDTDERRRFAQVSHEYLIEQVQFSNNMKLGSIDLNLAYGSSSDTVEVGDKHLNDQVELRFNHPVKEIYWRVEQHRPDSTHTELCDYVTCDDAIIQFNGVDRQEKRDGSYFTNVQRYQRHTGSDSENRVKGIHMHSFSLKPEEHQPSGTCNFSRLDNSVLNLTISNRAGSKIYEKDNNGLQKYLMYFEDNSGNTGNTPLLYLHHPSKIDYEYFDGESPGRGFIKVVGTEFDSSRGPTLLAWNGNSGADISNFSFEAKVLSDGSTSNSDYPNSEAGVYASMGNVTVNTVQNFGTMTNKMRIYAVNYNVLRIMSGMGGLAYSN